MTMTLGSVQPFTQFFIGSPKKFNMFDDFTHDSVLIFRSMFQTEDMLENPKRWFVRQGPL